MVPIVSRSERDGWMADHPAQLLVAHPLVETAIKIISGKIANFIVNVLSVLDGMSIGFRLLVPNVFGAAIAAGEERQPQRADQRQRPSDTRWQPLPQRYDPRRVEKDGDQSRHRA